jgi:predicted RNA binding protein YcfA (HicA-like mRNA interferase family)
MKQRKSRDIKVVLEKKGFKLNPQKDHHEYYFLVINGKKQSVYTYLSHSKKDYDSSLLSQIKKQLKFDNSEKFESFLDCPFTKENYFQMLKEKQIINTE